MCDERRIMSQQAVADHFDTSTTTIRRWRQSGDLPAFYVGGWKYYRADILAFEQRRRNATATGLRSLMRPA